MGLEKRYGLMGGNTLGSIKKTRSMVRGLRLGRTVQRTKAGTALESYQERAFTHGLMDRNTLVTSRTASLTEKAFLQAPTAHVTREISDQTSNTAEVCKPPLTKPLTKATSRMTCRTAKARKSGPLVPPTRAYLKTT